MIEQNYKQALEQARMELANAVMQRDSWNLQIVRLQDLVKALAATATNIENTEKYQAEVNRHVDLMQAIEAIVNGANEPLAPLAVRDGLNFYGYDLSGYANPMAMVHQTLKRLAEQRRIRSFPGSLYGRGFMLDPLPITR